MYRYNIAHIIFKYVKFRILAQRVGGRFKWLWLATLIHGFVVENVTFWTPEINNFWHSQTTIVLLGRRLPLHILCLCKKLHL